MYQLFKEYARPFKIYENKAKEKGFEHLNSVAYLSINQSINQSHHYDQDDYSKIFSKLIFEELSQEDTNERYFLSLVCNIWSSRNRDGIKYGTMSGTAI